MEILYQPTIWHFPTLQVVPGVINKTWTISYPGRSQTPPITATEWIAMWPCAVLTAALMLLTGCMSGDHARQSILWDVFLAIGGAFGVSATMERTNVANEFAQVSLRLLVRIFCIQFVNTKDFSGLICSAEDLIHLSHDVFSN